MDEWLDQIDVFAPPTRERLIDKVLSLIKDIIYSNKIEVGHKLPSERALAQRLKVSRSVVADALRSLERAGLVEIRTGAKGGAFVSYDIYMPLFQTMDDLLKGGRLSVSHFCGARTAVECESIRLAVEKATAKDIKHLRGLNRKILDHLEAKDRSKLRGDNLSFHLAIAEIGGNPIIILMVHSLIKLVDVVFPNNSSNYREFVLDQSERHEAIIQAMEAKDIQRCVELMRLEAESMKKLKRAGTGRMNRAKPILV
jgi:GntR family transcriptional repressor for pyruvate dehydrogenase complex